MEKSKFNGNNLGDYPVTVDKKVAVPSMRGNLDAVLKNLVSRVAALEEGGGGGGGVSTLVITGEFSGGAFTPDNNTPEFFDQALNGMKDGTHIVLFSYRGEGAEPGEENETEIATSAVYYSDSYLWINSQNIHWERPQEGE